jgi:O-antigen/teichoic acid export membrane protein
VLFTCFVIWEIEQIRLAAYRVCATHIVVERSGLNMCALASTDMSSKTSQTGAPAPAPPERPLARGVFLMLGTKVFVQIFSISGTIILARTLGPNGRGVIAVALGFALLLVQFGSLGLQSANLYFASRDLQRIGTIVINTLWVTAVVGAILIAVAFIVKAFFPASLRGLDWLEVIVLAAGLPVLLATSPLQCVFLAEGRIRLYNGIELVGSFLAFIGLAVGLTLLHIGVLGALAVLMGTNWVMVLTLVAFQRSRMPVRRRPDMELLRTTLKYGFRIYITTFLAFLVGRINLIFVNSHLGPTQAGFYAIGIGIGENLHLLPIIVPLNLFPRIARGETFESSAAAFRILCVVFGGFCLLTIPLVKPGLSLLYGSRFAAAADIYYWMLPGIFCYGMISVLAYHFAGRGFPIEAMLVWIPGLIINFAIMGIFLPGRGAYVAALAASVSYVLVLVLHMRMFAKESGCYRILLPRLRELFELPGMLLHSLRPRYVEH